MTSATIHQRREYVSKILDESEAEIEYRSVARMFGCSHNAIRADVAYIQSTRQGCTIYGLIDPRTQIVRYVGQTDGDPKYRHTRHISQVKHGRESNAVKAEWIEELLRCGLVPQLIVLETCPRYTLNERERWWIEDLQLKGNNLVNSIVNGKKGGRPRKQTE